LEQLFNKCALDILVIYTNVSSAGSRKLLQQKLFDTSK